MSIEPTKKTLHQITNLFYFFILHFSFFYLIHIFKNLKNPGIKCNMHINIMHPYMMNLIYNYNYIMYKLGYRSINQLNCDFITFSVNY